MTNELKSINEIDGPAYQIFAYGETDFPEVTFATSIGNARMAIAKLMFGSPSPSDFDEVSVMCEDLEEKIESDGIWSVTFEIGGIEVRKVFLHDSDTTADAATPSPVIKESLITGCERTMFERTCTQHEPFSRHPLNFDKYEFQNVEAAWRIWQQARSAPIAQPAQQVDERAEFEMRFAQNPYFNQIAKEFYWVGWQDRAAFNGKG